MKQGNPNRQPLNGPGHQIGLIDQVKSIAIDSAELFRDEIYLAKREISEKTDQIKIASISIITGLLLAFCGLLILLQALVVALSNVVPASIAALIVGGSVSLIALFLVYRGSKALNAEEIAPTRTVRAAEQSYEAVKAGLQS